MPSTHMTGKKAAVLCETGVTRLLTGALSDCRERARKRWEMLFNVGAGLLLIGGFATFLFYKRKSRSNPRDAAYKRERDYRYIVDRLSSLQQQADSAKGLITRLPMIDARAAAPQLAR